ncbi:MAG: Txe/YoeB family addiction module toxin [Tenacibaculum sp.]|nr:Txe/YoeB family addiction module toxin [Tenacibaculum sp.]
MKYVVTLSEVAEFDLYKLKKNEPNSYKKAMKLISELYEHPETGTGKPEKLKKSRSGQWSRRINSKHRLIYTINDDDVEVYVISSYGHYNDK